MGGGGEVGDLEPREELQWRTTAGGAIGDVGGVCYSLNVDAGIPSENVPLPLSFCYGDDCNCLKYSNGFLEDDQKLLIDTGEKDDLPELPDDQKFFNLPELLDDQKFFDLPELPDDQKFFDSPELYQLDPASVTDESFVELNDLANPMVANYHALGHVDELGHVDASHNTPVNQLGHVDAFHNTPVNDGLFLEISDFSNLVESDPLGFDMEEYLSYFNDTDDNSQYVGEDPVLNQSKEVNGGVVKAFLESPQPFKTHCGDGASSSKQNLEATESELDVQNGEGKHDTLIKRASRMLGCIPAPPAFAAEFPTKDVTVGKNSATHSSNPIHVTTGMIQISSMTINGNEKDWSLGENRDVNFMFYGMTRADLMAADHLISNSVGLEPMGSLLSSNAGSLMVRSGFYLILFSVLILSVSFKIGTYIYSK
ncbi:hypothetical protein HHK36_011247 [Tetracentron sinense]|uniref:Uncharacterized protein n=1 Tax=Tetracentron sinense TaxID=13715 RepID=A0A834ZCG7_TETSI|nr:hypothetical protein HHK36_011247 [Tetracentron sinense]